MKRLSALLLVLCMLLALCGCEALSLAENVQPYFTGEEFKESEQYYKNYYYPLSDFQEAPKEVFRANTGYGGEYINKTLFMNGYVQDTVLENGMRYFVLSTDDGTVYVSNGLFTLPKIENGTKVKMFFVYLGHNKGLGYVTGAYVDYLLSQ